MEKCTGICNTSIRSIAKGILNIKIQDIIKLYIYFFFLSLIYFLSFDVVDLPQMQDESYK